MLQWLPGSKTRILWNDREGKSYVCRILDVKTRELRTVPHPIYALSPDGRSAIATDFRRLGDTRPGYGYNGIPDPHVEELTPRDSGIWRVDLESGKQQLILSIADVARFGRPLPTMKDAKHWFNHLLFNPDGSRFVFLHRWHVGRGRETRMLTADPDGKNLRVVDDNGITSHFIWRDPKHILAWSNQPSHGKAFYLFEDGGGKSIEVVGKGVMTQDGHCSYLPGNEWILNDTYPDSKRMQNPYLFHVKSGRRVSLGQYHSPPGYTGEWRCDIHARFSPDGRTVVFDSPHGEAGRQLRLIEVGKIVG
jgi:Tol biopolymer transport system component